MRSPTSILRLLAVFGLGLTLSGSPGPLHADVSAPFLVEDVDRDYFSHLPHDRIVPWELEDTTLLVRSRAFEDDEPGVWRTDGTPAGTVPLPLPGGEHIQGVLARTADRKRLYYHTDPPGSGGTLYVTDGTVQGTVALLTTDSFNFANAFYRPETDRLIFRRFERPGGPGDPRIDALWVTDGTVEGTRRVLPAGEPRDRMSLIGAAGPYVYFLSESPESRLFRTDGTAAGTREVHPGLDEVDARNTIALGDLFLVVREAPDGDEVWASDGTPGGTTRLAGPFAEREIGGPVRSGDLVYWNVGSLALLRTDGTPAGTRLVYEIPRPDSGSEPYLTDLVPFGDGRVLFDGHSEATGEEPWVSDGTVAGTRLLADVCPGSCSSHPEPLAGWSGGAYFTADDGTTGEELYGVGVGGPNGDGARRLADLCPGPCSSEIRLGDHADGRLAFFADDGERGVELYGAEGLEAPVRLSDFLLDDAVDDNVFGDFVETLTETGFYFNAVTRNGPRFLRSDFTPGGLFPLTPPVDAYDPIDSAPAGLATFEGDLVFLAHDAEVVNEVFETRETRLNLYRKTGNQRSRPLGTLATSEGAAFSRAPVHETRVASGRVFALLGSQPALQPKVFHSVYAYRNGVPGVARLVEGLSFGDAWAVGERLFFINRGNQGGLRQLWVSDGTAAGTRVFRERVKSLDATPFRGRLLYEEGFGLYLTDGADAGTRLWLDLGGQGLSEVDHLTPHPDGVYFTARRAGASTRQLFFSDGTAAGTRRVSRLGQKPIHVFGLLGDRLLYYVARPSAGRFGLWATGLTADETVHLIERPLGEHRSFGRLGDEMWIAGSLSTLLRTDGTPQGSELLDSPDDELFDDFRIYEIPGHLLFSSRAQSRVHLFVTDGSPGPPRPLGELWSFGREVEAVGDRVYFAADGLEPYDGGFELWAAELDGLAPPPPPPPTGDLTAPADVRAAGRDGGIDLLWTDTSSAETRFVIQAQGWTTGSAFETVMTVPEDGTLAFLTPLALPQNEVFNDPRPVRLRIRAENDSGVSPWSEVVDATPLDAGSSRCLQDRVVDALCLQDGRFAVRVFWRDFRGDTHGLGVPSPFDFSDDSGSFSFFDAANIELVVKVLDARVINGNFWSFYGALSDVEYWVVVTDLEADSNVTYYNPAENLCGRADTASFPRPSLRAVSGEPAGRRAGRAVPGEPDRSLPVCLPDEDTLCLAEANRFRVTVHWRDPRSGDSGFGRAIPATTDSGYFWFFDAANVELVVKVLDARAVNGFHWVFYGALTDVEYTLTVIDTVTGESKQYVNPPGNICGEADVRAF